jgi:L-fucose mutarotase
MLTYRLLHPEILEALAASGHGSRVLIADGNYALATNTYDGARRVFLNLAPDLVRVTDVLEVLTDAIPIEAAHVMLPDEGGEPPIFADFRSTLPGLELSPLGRFDFYDAGRAPTLALAIATGDRRLYANILLTIGFIPPDAMP